MPARRGSRTTVAAAQPTVMPVARGDGCCARMSSARAQKMGTTATNPSAVERTIRNQPQLWRASVPPSSKSAYVYIYIYIYIYT